MRGGVVLGEVIEVEGRMKGKGVRAEGVREGSEGGGLRKGGIRTPGEIQDGIDPNQHAQQQRIQAMHHSCPRIW